MSVEKPLGMGTYGVVYRDKDNDIDVAVKISLHDMKNEVKILKHLATTLHRPDILKYVNYLVVNHENGEFVKYRSKYQSILDNYYDISIQNNPKYLDKLAILLQTKTF